MTQMGLTLKSTQHSFNVINRHVMNKNIKYTPLKHTIIYQMSEKIIYG
jgi:hypothetical protein